MYTQSISLKVAKQIFGSFNIEPITVGEKTVGYKATLPDGNSTELEHAVLRELCIRLIATMLHSIKESDVEWIVPEFPKGK